jgi:tetratricopeptide (TPR) repeat protein
MRALRFDYGLQNLILAAFLLIGVVVVMSQRGSLTGRLMNDQRTLQRAAELRPFTRTDDLIAGLQDRIRRKPADLDSYAQLGAAYVQRARETGDPTYYARAEAVLESARQRDPQHVETLISRGTLALARHQFREALLIGEQARALNPSIPRIYGVIGDAQVELGMYDEAVATIQTMVDLRPDLGSYSRVSYLRELHGDLDGAIEAMQAALNAGGPAAENVQWVRVQLGHLHFKRGDLDTAEKQYDAALKLLPDYMPALAGLAQIDASRREYESAIERYTEVTQRMPLPEYIAALGDVYARAGDSKNAQAQYDLVGALDRLLAANGVNTDLEIALFYADHDSELESALAKAQAAYAERPGIHAADVLAWTLYKAGRYAEARRYSDESLRLGTRDALKLFHAGMIAHALGQDDAARTYLQQAIDLNPHFSIRWSDAAVQTLQELKSQGGR